MVSRQWKCKIYPLALHWVSWNLLITYREYFKTKVNRFCREVLRASAPLLQELIKRASGFHLGSKIHWQVKQTYGMTSPTVSPSFWNVSVAFLNGLSNTTSSRKHSDWIVDRDPWVVQLFNFDCKLGSRSIASIECFTIPYWELQRVRFIMGILNPTDSIKVLESTTLLLIPPTILPNWLSDPLVNSYKKSDKLREEN